MTVDPAHEFQKVFDSLKNFGLLVVSDATFPSVGSLISGAGIKGSWWSHPMAQTIFNLNEMLEDHKDVLIVKLISGKVTFVHRTLWKYVYAIAVAREEWQTKNLSNAARTLLKKLDQAEKIDSSNIGPIGGKKPGAVSKELELALLVYAEQVHTASGSHAKIIETWKSWATRVGLKNKTMDSSAAKRFMEKRVAELNEQFSANGCLPWPIS